MATGPAYMNAITSHPKVKATITLLAPLFVAGQEITGKVELECKAEREVGIGLIMIELLAAQELNSRDHTAATTFIHSRRVFQGPGLPPSNAVYDHALSQDPSFPPSYFPGRKGVTTFFFKFPTPISSPSSVSFASDLAKIEYKIRASVGFSYKGDTRLLSNNVNAEVVQFQDMEGTVDEHVVVGEGGKVYVRGRLIGGRVITGEKGCLELHVKNQTAKNITGLTLTLTRSLHLHGAGASIPVQLTDTVFSESFRTAEYCVPPGVEGVANLVFDVPSSTRVVKGGTREDNADSSGARKQIEPLFELRCYLSVKIGMGLGSKDIMFEMPIQVKHRAVLGKDPVNTYLSPLSPEPVFNRALSLVPPHNPRAVSPLPNPHANLVSPVHHTGQTPVPTHSPTPGYTQYNQPPPKPTIHPPALNPGDPAFARAVSPHLWSPTSPPPIAPYYSQSPPPAYYFPPPPVQLLPFAYPARPSSADPYYHPYQEIQNNVPSGLPPLAGSPAFYSPYPPMQPLFQYQTPLFPVSNVPQPPTSVPPPIQTQVLPQVPIQVETQADLPPTSSRLQLQPNAESGDQPAEGKGERASRIAQRLHVSTRARSVSPTSHRFPISSIATTKQPPPQKITLPPARLHATSPRHPVVLSPKPLISPSRTYFGESPRRIGNGTAKSDRVDLLEQLVDLAPGEEEKSVEEVLRDLEDAEKRQEDKKDNQDSIRLGPVKLVNPSGGPNTRQNLSLLDVFNKHPPVSKESQDNSLSPSLPLPHGSTATPGNVLKPDTRNEGLDALEKRLLQDVGTRKPDTVRPTIFDLGLLDKSTTQSPLEQPSAKQGKVDSPPHSPHTVRLHPRQFRESQISELALGYDVDGNVERKNPEPLSPALPNPVQSHEEEKSRKNESGQSNKGIVMRDEAKGRVSEWLGGLPQFPTSPTRAEAAPTTYLAEPKRAPPRKRSIDNVLGFFRIGKNQSREDLRATSPVIASSPVLPKVSKQSDARTELSKSIDIRANLSQSTSTNLPLKLSSMPKGFPKPEDKPSPGILSQSPLTNPSPIRHKISEQSVSGESSKQKDKLAIPVQPKSAPAPSPQNRAPSPSRKPVPKHVNSALDEPLRKLEVDSAPRPRRLSDAHPILKPTVKTGGIDGTPTKGTPVTQPNNETLPDPKAASSTKVTDMQPALRNEARLPTKPIKPEGLRDKSISTPQAIVTPARTPKPILPPKPNLEIREGMKNKGTLPTLPSVPISAQQRLNLSVSDPEIKYDLRSARGGRGGITTSVAAIWASRAEGTNGGKEIPTSSPAVSRDNAAQKQLRPPRFGEIKPNATSTATAPKIVPKVEDRDSPVLSAKSSQDPIKGASVPAQVDRYHAKPQLSSVATLAQPVLNTKYKPPSLSMTLGAVPESTPTDNASSSNSSAKAGEIPLGRMRLKELIKKYQEAAS